MPENNPLFKRAQSASEGCEQQENKPRQVSYLIASLLLSILPFFNELPLWVMFLVAGLAGWGLLINFAKLGRPGKLLKIATVVSCLCLLSIGIENWFSLQAFVSLLTLTAALKLIELQGRREFILLIFLGCFVSICQLLFSNSLQAFGYVLCCLLLFHWCLLQAVNCVDVKRLSRKHQGLKVVQIFLQGLPLALVLFLVMPRIGSLWKVPLNTQIAKTGVADNLSIGDISRLNQDTSVAMRVTFDNNRQPDTSGLYWRGVTLSDFDGSTWRRDKQLRPLAPEQQAKLKAISATSMPANTLSYQVMIEASGRNWLYALSTPISDAPSTRQWSDYSLSKEQILTSRQEYHLTSNLEYRNSQALSEQQRSKFTSLPSLQNPKTRLFAEQLKAQYPEPQQYIDNIFNYFKQGFSYTLSPGRLTDVNAIDDFMFERQRGYCEHFASSTAFLLRAAGIPARIAVGYQGGQWSVDKRYLLVTQAQAHAWVEAWIAGRGWVRLDPTTAVAPTRIEQGASQFLAQMSGLESDYFNLRQNSLIRQLGLQWDSVNYQWHRWVLGYDNQLQLQIVMQLLGGVDSWRILLLILLAIGVAVLPVLLFALWPRSRQAIKKPLIHIQKLETKLAKLGLERARHETIGQFLQRAGKHSPVNFAVLDAINKATNSLLYQSDGQAGERQTQEHLQKLINKIKV